MLVSSSDFDGEEVMDQLINTENGSLIIEPKHMGDGIDRVGFVDPYSTCGLGKRWEEGGRVKIIVKESIDFRGIKGNDDI